MQFQYIHGWKICFSRHLIFVWKTTYCFQFNVTQLMPMSEKELRKEIAKLFWKTNINTYCSLNLIFWFVCLLIRLQINLCLKLIVLFHTIMFYEVYRKKTPKKNWIQTMISSEQKITIDLKLSEGWCHI